MDNNRSYIDLVEKARRGDKKCLGRLAEMANKRLYGCVHRFTLQDGLTEDIVQESILEMYRAFHKLKEAERFWDWLYRIAFNKVRSHYGKRWRQKTISLANGGHEIEAPNCPDGLAAVIADEWRQIVAKSMRELEPRHRAILAMRCYDRMPYSRIATVMGCTKLGAQALFYRAKKALTMRLSHYGLGKGSLLVALMLFGKMTASSKAAAAKVSVTAATTKVGAAAALVGMAATKAAFVSLAAAGVIGAGVLVATANRQGTNSSAGPGAVASSQTAAQSSRQDKFYEEYYYFPEGTGGPVMMRAMVGDPKSSRYGCQWVLDAEANYYLDWCKDIARIESYRPWREDLSAWRLPTDTEQFRHAISAIEGKVDNLQYVRADGPHLMVVVQRCGNDSNVWTARHRHVLKEEYFKYTRPAGAKVVDNRDAMHRRGWTYFRISGQIDGERVSGAGRMPFVYAESREHGPWLRLRAGNRLQVIDDGQLAVVRREGNVAGRYAGGAFFKGLSRPWMGLHTIDTVRRDAAEKGIRFETKYDAKEGTAEVLLTDKRGRFVYRIDMETDVVEKIVISTNGVRKAELRFSYLQDIEDVGTEFAEPPSEHRVDRERPGILWLFEMALSG
jgi:RNA polymerase sigma-70 factor (ECF subfamily)